MAEQQYGLPDDRKLNRFILFYTLRWFWKQYKKSVPELYGVLMNGNRTLYSRILRQEDVYLDDKKLKVMEDAVGISKEYFDGKKQLQISGIGDDQWKNFYNSYRNDFQGVKDTVIGKSVIVQLKAVLENPRICNSTLFALHYFAQNGIKKNTENIVEIKLTKNIDAIYSLNARELSTLDVYTLLATRWKLERCLNRIDSIITYKTW